MKRQLKDWINKEKGIKNMKKILALLLAVCMVFAFAACSGEEAPVENAETTAQKSPVVETPKEEVKKEEPKMARPENKNEKE